MEPNVNNPRPVELAGERLQSDDISRRTGGSDSISHNHNEQKGRHGTCRNTGKGTPSRQVTEKIAFPSDMGNVPERETVSQVITAPVGLEAVIGSLTIATRGRVRFDIVAVHEHKQSGPRRCCIR